MNRGEALTLIRKRAMREHGTLVQALGRVLDEIANIGAHITARADCPGDAVQVGFMLGMNNAVELVEEALFEAFNVWPNVDGQSLSDRLRGLEATVDPPMWGQIMTALYENATADQRADARRQLLALAWEGRDAEDGMSPETERQLADLGTRFPLALIVASPSGQWQAHTRWGPITTDNAPMLGELLDEIYAESSPPGLPSEADST